MTERAQSFAKGQKSRRAKRKSATHLLILDGSFSSLRQLAPCCRILSQVALERHEREFDARAVMSDLVDPLRERFPKSATREWSGDGALAQVTDLGLNVIERGGLVHLQYKEFGVSSSASCLHKQRIRGRLPIPPPEQRLRSHCNIAI